MFLDQNQQPHKNLKDYQYANDENKDYIPEIIENNNNDKAINLNVIQEDDNWNSVATKAVNNNSEIYHGDFEDNSDEELESSIEIVFGYEGGNNLPNDDSKNKKRVR
jgi:predicted house-cleaning noncanonical NTP pyrophosphatase (MazG superfamily)